MKILGWAPGHEWKTCFECKNFTRGRVVLSEQNTVPLCFKCKEAMNSLSPEHQQVLENRISQSLATQASPP